MTKDHGVIVAALTPRGKKGDLDFGAAFELIDRLCAARVSGIALFTAAGEYPAFSLDERSRLLYLAAKRSRVPLYAGAGSIGLTTRSTWREGRNARARQRCFCRRRISFDTSRKRSANSISSLPARWVAAFRPTWPTPQAL